MTTRFPRARRIVLDGAEAVALPPDDFERLDSIRRQAGAQVTRIHTFRQQLADATATLDAIAAAVRQARCITCPDSQSAACVREAVSQILDGAGDSRTGSRSVRTAARDQSDAT
jgi:hypothetical protein